MPTRAAEGQVNQDRQFSPLPMLNPYRVRAWRPAYPGHPAHMQHGHVRYGRVTR